MFIPEGSLAGSTAPMQLHVSYDSSAEESDKLYERVGALWHKIIKADPDLQPKQLLHSLEPWIVPGDTKALSRFTAIFKTFGSGFCHQVERLKDGIVFPVFSKEGSRIGVFKIGDCRLFLASAARKIAFKLGLEDCVVPSMPAAIEAPDLRVFNFSIDGMDVQQPVSDGTFDGGVREFQDKQYSDTAAIAGVFQPWIQAAEAGTSTTSKGEIGKSKFGIQDVPLLVLMLALGCTDGKTDNISGGVLIDLEDVLISNDPLKLSYLNQFDTQSKLPENIAEKLSEIVSKWDAEAVVSELKCLDTTDYADFSKKPGEGYLVDEGGCIYHLSDETKGGKEEDSCRKFEEDDEGIIRFSKQSIENLRTRLKALQSFNYKRSFSLEDLVCHVDPRLSEVARVFADFRSLKGSPVEYSRVVQILSRQSPATPPFELAQMNAAIIPPDDSERARTAFELGEIFSAIERHKGRLDGMDGSKRPQSR